MNNKVKSTAEESLELAALLESKPQIDQKLNFYKETLQIEGELHEALKERLKKGFTVTKCLVFGFIPVTIRNVFDSTDIQKLKKEIKDVEDSVFNHKQYYENWVGRMKEYEFKMDEISRECNQYFDEVLKQAREINGNLRLNDTLKEYDALDEKGDKNAKNDQQLRNEIYLYLKQEVNNALVHKNRRK